MAERYDLIVVGAGPAGLGGHPADGTIAALAAQRYVKEHRA